MSIKASIDRIKPYANGWSRTQILNLYQQGQDELMNGEEAYMHFIPTDNEGFPPYLQTTDGTYRYNINNINLASTLVKNIGSVDRAVRCKRVIMVFVDPSNDNEYTRKWMGQTTMVGYNNPFRRTNERIFMARIPCSNSPALENTEAYVEFPDNPGTTTDQYFCDCIWEAPRLTAETIPLVVPVMYEKALEDFALGTIEQFSNGKMGERLNRFYYGNPDRQIPSWINQFQTEMDIGATIDDWQTELMES